MSSFLRISPVWWSFLSERKIISGVLQKFFSIWFLQNSTNFAMTFRCVRNFYVTSLMNYFKNWASSHSFTTKIRWCLIPKLMFVLFLYLLIKEWKKKDKILYWSWTSCWRICLISNRCSYFVVLVLDQWPVMTHSWVKSMKTSAPMLQ